MAIKTTAIASVMTEEIPIAPTELIYDDGEPMESNRHRIAMNILIDSVNLALSDRQDFLAGGNMFIRPMRETTRKLILAPRNLVFEAII